MDYNHASQHIQMDISLSRRHSGMQKVKHYILWLCAVFMLVATSYGWELNSGIRAVDKVTSRIKKVNDSLNGLSAENNVVPESRPDPGSTSRESSITSRPSASTVARPVAATTATTVPQSEPVTAVNTVAQPATASKRLQPENNTDAKTEQSEDEIYNAKLNAVRDGLNKASAKMPLRGGDQVLYNAAYEFSSNDKQKSFLPPAKRAENFSGDKMKLVDEFIIWVAGGMKSFDSQRATALRIEWQKKIQTAREADQITFDASKELDKQACMAASQIISENMAAQYVSTMKEKLDEKKKEYSDYKVAHADEIAAAEAAKKKQLEKEKAEKEAAIAKQKQIAAQKAAEKKAQEEKSKAEQEALKKEKAYIDEIEGLKSRLRSVISIVTEDYETNKKVVNDAVSRGDTETREAHIKRMQEIVSKYEKEAKVIERKRELKGRLSDALGKLFSAEKVFKEHAEIEKIKKAIEARENTDTAEGYVKRLQEAVDQYEGMLANIIEKRTALNKKVAEAEKYAEEKCARDNYLNEGLLTPEHKAELEKLLAGVTQEDLADLVRRRNDRMLFVAVQMITDQKVLEDLLVTNTGWVDGGYRDGLFCHDFSKAYYMLYRNITDQELLMKLWHKDEISFSTESTTAYGYKSPMVLKYLDKDHIEMLNRQRIARRRAAHGRTVDVKGFYIGMPRRDFELLSFMRGLTDDDVSGSFGVWKVGPVNRLWFSKTFVAKELNIVKDGIVGISMVTEMFVPGGAASAGEIHINGETRDTYDIDREEVNIKVDTFWWRNCAKLECPVKIKMYDGGTLVVEADSKDVKLDLKAAEGMMNESFDESELDCGTDTDGGFLSFVIFIGGVVGVLYFFRGKVDAFVATHPKYEKTWIVTCKAGNVAKDYTMKAIVFVKGKVEEIKNKKAK